MPEETQSQQKRSRARSARLPPRRLNLYNPPQANSSSFWLRGTEARGFVVVILALLCILPLSKFFRFLCDSAHRAVGFCFGGYMVIVLSLLVAILGLLAYFMASN